MKHSLASTVIAFAVCFFGLFCFAAEETSTAVSVAPAPAVIRNYKNFYISGTPTAQQLKDFKKQKGAGVLDLRAFDELGACSEPAATIKAGLKYNRVNFDHSDTIDRETISSIDKVVKANGKKPMLLFCTTGSRSSAWLAIHLVETDKMPIDEAVAIAKGTGLSEGMEKKVREYLR